MRAVKFDRIAADPLGIDRAARERGDHLVDIGGGHHAPARNVWADEARGAFERRMRRIRPVEILATAHVPELRDERTARVVDISSGARPSRKAFLAVESRHRIRRNCAWPIDRDALCDDGCNPAFDTAAIVIRRFLRENAARREIARHRRHQEAIGKVQRLAVEWREERIE